MKPLLVLLCLLLISCASVKDGLTVKQYHLRENMFDENDDPMVRGEVQRMLHGAVSVKEREQKIGQYYHVIWKEPTRAPQPVLVVFEYLQAASGSTVKKIVREGTPQNGRFDAYVEIAGHDYEKKGRVLAWRVTASQRGQMLATKKSYMWR